MPMFVEAVDFFSDIRSAQMTARNVFFVELVKQQDELSLSQGTVECGSVCFLEYFCTVLDNLKFFGGNVALFRSYNVSYLYNYKADLRVLPNRF